MNKCEIYTGDCLAVLKGMPDKSVHTCVTSPPYFGLRNYDVDGQIGLEETPDEYIEKLVNVFEQVRRVLRDDGTLWLNLGDSYAGGNTNGKWREGSARADGEVRGDGNNSRRNRNGIGAINGLKPKDLMGIPWRVALALQARGWYLRQDIIWAKGCSGNYRGGAVMPESVQDRCTRAHEYVFLLSKSQRYYYDSEAVREPNVDTERVNYVPGREAYSVGNVHDASGRERRNEGLAAYKDGKACIGRNRRSVWAINTKPYSSAHFATYPLKLIEPCVKAGTSEKGCCSKCGAPLERIIEKGFTSHDGKTESAYDQKTTANRLALLRQAARERGEEYANIKKTIGWKAACNCESATKPCIVLDPFFGAGTTGIVAGQLGRDCVGIEINPEYVELAADRIKKEIGLLVKTEVKK